MVRGLVAAAAFLAFVIVLIALQPGLPAQAPVAALEIETAVSRNDTNLLAEVSAAPESDPLKALVDQALSEAPAPAVAPVTDIARMPAPAPTPTHVADTPAAPLSDTASADMTWDVLRNLDQATRRAAKPGSEGSLLSVLINRSLADPQLATDTAYIAALAREAALPQAQN